MMSSEKEQRRANLLCGIDQDAPALRFGNSGCAFSVMLGEMAISVFHHHNGRVDQHADGQRQPAERHDVRSDVQVVHGDEGHQHSQRQ